MSLKWGRGAFLSTLAAVTVAASSFAGAQQDATVKVNVNLKDADMMTATRTVTNMAGVQFLVEPSTEPFAKITLQIKDVTAEEAIRYICQAAGAEFRRDEHGVFIIGHHVTTPILVPADAPKAATKTVSVKRKIRIMKADAHDVYDQLMSRVPSQTRGFDELKRFAQSVSPTQNLVGGAPVQFYGNGPVQTVRPTGLAPVGTPTLSTNETSNQIVMPGGSGEAAGQGFGGGTLGGGGGGLGGGQNPGGGAAGQNGQGSLRPGEGLVPDGIEFISYDPTDNSLVVVGPEEDYLDLVRTVELFDQAPRQVLVKVEFITTTEGTTRDFGTEFQYQRGVIQTGTSPGSFVRSGDPVYLNYASGNVVSRLRTLLSETNGKVVSAPILRTLNNQPALIFASVTQYVFINQIAGTGNVIINAPQPQPITATTSLNIAPRINADNTITLYLTPNISAFVGTSIGPDGQELPNQTTQFLAVVARVRNGETMVLGGLTSKSDDDSINRVPVLSELPILGQFFRSSRRSRTQSELLIFVTPTIVDEDTTGSPGSNNTP